MEKISDIKNKLDMLEEELKDVKKVLVTMGPANTKKNYRAWKRLVKAGKEVSRRWKGKDAAGEIREQRTK